MRQRGIIVSRLKEEMSEAREGKGTLTELCERNKTSLGGH